MVNRNRFTLTGIIFCVICILFLFFRTFEFMERAQVSVDQTDNAWAAYRIIAEHRFPLTGMRARMSSITIGPLYYYYAAIFYWFTNLDFVASPVIAFVTSLVNFAILFVVTKRMFGTKTALIAAGINATSVYFINADRSQVPINFIPSVGILLFYYLHEILGGKSDNIPWLAVVLGLSFHIHFTSIFYPVIIAVTLPWWPKIQTHVRRYLYGAALCAVFFIPMSIQSIVEKQFFWQGSVDYIAASNHGFHVRRVLQLAHDAFIEFESILMFRFFRPFVFFVIPLFMYIHNVLPKRKDVRVGILLSLWIVVPWIGFSLYSGEITNYYFSTGRYIALMIISYVLLRLWNLHTLSKIVLSVFALCFVFFNTQKFFSESRGNLLTIEKKVTSLIQSKHSIPFVEGDPESYVYTVYTKKR